MRKIRRALNRRNCLPLNKPFTDGLLTPQELAQLPPHQREERFSDWEKYRKSIIETEKQNLEAALIRMTLCAYLHSFTSLLKPYRKPRKHYSWCVCEEWEWFPHSC